jgi:hypothetical protein
MTERAIHLTQEGGTNVEFTAAVSANQIRVLSQVKGTSLDEITIVQEFPNIFSRGVARYATPLRHQVSH